MMKKRVAICWFRRDLRLYDHAALFHALKDHEQVLPLFIFDRHILDKLEDQADRRVCFIYESLLRMQEKLLQFGSTLLVQHGFPEQVFLSLSEEFNITHVYANHDYEPYGIERDKLIGKLLSDRGIPFLTFKDHVIFEKDEIRKPDNTPYTVFTPYGTKWISELTSSRLEAYPVEKYYDHLIKENTFKLPSLETFGFVYTAVDLPTELAANTIVSNYDKQRDFPGANGTSRMSVHLRFGTISIRELARKAHILNATYLKELVWREFYQMILWKFPAIGKGEAFRKAYDRIVWRNNEAEFRRWSEGKTGYPLVDAGMRELNSTGFMHNRVRMVVASFLCKHLLIDWRWGEAYFASRLLDYELASNNGGWQWASGSGCDAVPYFRIFNPTLQARKFDPQQEYIRKWIPEIHTDMYPKPIVDHDFARKRCLEVYSKAIRASAY